MPRTDTQARYRLAAWIIGVGAVLLVFGYLTSAQWLGLVGSLLG